MVGPTRSTAIPQRRYARIAGPTATKARISASGQIHQQDRRRHIDALVHGEAHCSRPDPAHDAARDELLNPAYHRLRGMRE